MKITQDVLDRLAKMRKRGYSIAEMRKRSGVSERSIKRYLGNIDSCVDINQSPAMRLDKQKLLMDCMNETNKWFNKAQLPITLLNDAAKYWQRMIDNTEKLLIEMLKENIDVRERWINELLRPLLSNMKIKIQINNQDEALDILFFNANLANRDEYEVMEQQKAEHIRNHYTDKVKNTLLVPY